jgi:mannobiose 2-epimerase
LDLPAPRAADVERVLQRHVLDVWFPRSLDREYGGFLCDFDYRWKPCGANEKLLEFQARHTWFAAEASRLYPADERLREAVRHGFDYLRGPLWDAVSGGWFHRLDRAGKPLEGATKHTHGHAYAISACVAVYEATGDQTALELAQKGFGWVERYARDDEYDGYFGYLRRDGTLMNVSDEGQRDSTDTLGTPIVCKDINVHSDLLGTFTYLYRVWSDAGLAKRLAEIVEIVCNRMGSPLGAHFHYCLADWTPVPHLTRFGYQFQSAFRLCAAMPYLGGKEEILLMARGFAEHALLYGYDGKRGGFYYASPGLKPDRIEGHSLRVRKKLWWVQVEALKALLALQRVAPDDERYSKSFSALWNYILEYLIDPTYGGFRMASLEELPRWRQISPSFAPHSYTLKGSDWKDCSHEGRALLYCMSVLKEREAALERSPVGSAGAPEPI